MAKLLIILFIFLFVSCTISSLSQETEEPRDNISVLQEETLTPVPTPTLEPTSTSTLEPTPTPIPTPTSTPTNTPIPTPTSTPTNTPIPTPTLVYSPNQILVDYHIIDSTIKPNLENGIKNNLIRSFIDIFKTNISNGNASFGVIPANLDIVLTSENISNLEVLFPFGLFCKRELDGSFIALIKEIFSHEILSENILDTKDVVLAFRIFHASNEKLEKFIILTCNKTDLKFALVKNVEIKTLENEIGRLKEELVNYQTPSYAEEHNISIERLENTLENLRYNESQFNSRIRKYPVEVCIGDDCYSLNSNFESFDIVGRNNTVSNMTIDARP